jgi:transposase-like protein
MEEDSKGTGLGNVIRIDDDRIRDHLGKIVRGSVEETLNALLEAEADPLCNAGRYERSEARRDLRSGSYERKLQTRAGEVCRKVPKLRRQAFETAIIERYRRRESSVEEASPAAVRWGPLDLCLALSPPPERGGRHCDYQT